MEQIKNIVKYFFMCKHCQEHFLRAYDECWLGRCEVGAEDFGALQVYLHIIEILNTQLLG